MPEIYSGRWPAYGMTPSPRPIHTSDTLSAQIYDWLLTFDLEVAFVWGSRWNFLKVMYFLNRYDIVFDLVLVYLGEYLSRLVCHSPQLNIYSRGNHFRHLAL